AAEGGHDLPAVFKPKKDRNNLGFVGVNFKICMLFLLRGFVLGDDFRRRAGGAKLLDDRLVIDKIIEMAPRPVLRRRDQPFFRSPPQQPLTHARNTSIMLEG
ncbi:MAG: hypothetical protein LBB65_07200, partial [Burkholderiales bacterium]|nr:hypothetical protein [Burkholderiales bacterium]